MPFQISDWYSGGHLCGCAKIVSWPGPFFAFSG